MPEVGIHEFTDAPHYTTPPSIEYMGLARGIAAILDKLLHARRSVRYEALPSRELSLRLIHEIYFVAFITFLSMLGGHRHVLMISSAAMHINS
jgi:hypothetical protein